jgi:hypothetical protein
MVRDAYYASTSAEETCKRSTTRASLGKARHATPGQTSSGRQPDESLFAVEWKTAVLASAPYLTSQEERSANRSSITIPVGISSCEAHS